VSGVSDLVCSLFIELSDCSSVFFRLLVSFGQAVGVVFNVSGSLVAYIDIFPFSLGYMLPCHAGLLMDSIHLFEAPTGYCLKFGRMVSYLGELRGSFLRFFKTGSEWWENSTPPGLVVGTQPKKVPVPRSDPEAPVCVIVFPFPLSRVRYDLEGRTGQGIWPVRHGFGMAFWSLGLG
jgi:hypothetical protein